MVEEHDFHQLLRELTKNDSSAIAIGESDVVLKIFDGKTKLSLATAIYDGDGIIPSSVREAAAHPLPAHSAIHTQLRTDDERGKIFLSYLGALDRLSKGGFRDLLDSFAQEADRWRNYLDENDHREKVHVKRR